MALYPYTSCFCQPEPTSMCLRVKTSSLNSDFDMDASCLNNQSYFFLGGGGEVSGRGWAAGLLVVVFFFVVVVVVLLLFFLSR